MSNVFFNVVNHVRIVSVDLCLNRSHRMKPGGVEHYPSDDDGISNPEDDFI